MPSERSTPTPRVGLVGLGRMGGPMARRIRAAGLPLAVHDLDRDVVAAIADETGAVACATAAEVARRSDVVMTVLPDGGVVRAVVGDAEAPADGTVLSAIAPGALLVEASSIAPEESRALAEAAAAHGVGYVDAPVSGGVTGAVAGTLAVMAGGDAADLQRCAPIFDAIAQTVLHCGPAGCGHAAKALNNAVSAAGLIAASEALLAGQHHGIEPSVLVAVLNASSGRNYATERKVEQFMLSRTFASGFELALLVKDLRIALGMTLDAGVPPGAAAQSLATASAAMANLGTHADHTAVLEWLERQAGAELAEPVAAGGQP